MWLSLYYGMFQGFTHYILLSLFGEKDVKYLISCGCCGLIAFCLSLFIHPILSILIGHILFIFMNGIFRLSINVSIVSVLFNIMLQCIFFPISRIQVYYYEAWEYIFYSSICIYLIIMYFVYNSSKLEKEWLRQEFNYLNNKAYLLIILPIFGVVLNLLIIVATHQSTLISHCIGIIFMIIIFIFFLIMISLVVYIERYKQLEETMNKWQKESRDYINVIRSQRHDFNFHVHAIVGLIENGEYEECRNYVTKVASDAARVNDIMPVHDAVIGSMLYNMREMARQKGTDITYDITYDMEHVLCNSFEINKILGNLIQNALDALNSDIEKAGGIKVKIFKRRGNTVISVSNLFYGDKNAILRAFDLGYSTKNKHEGIGLSMISKTVEKYNGRIYMEFNDDWVTFIVNIPNYVHFEEEMYENKDDNRR